MRIVIDMQGAQTKSRYRGVGHYAMSFAQAVVRNKGEHEVILALSGLFPDSIETIRAAFDGLLPQEYIRVWHAPGPVAAQHFGNETRSEVAELIREAFLASLQPDVIHISSLFEGYVDDSVTSIGKFDKRTPVSVSLYDPILLHNTEQDLKSKQRYELHCQHKLSHLRQAARCFAISKSVFQQAVAHLGAPESQVVTLPAAADPRFRPCSISEDKAHQLRHRFGLTCPFVLCMGVADERENLPRLIRAWASLLPELSQTHQLLFVGKLSDTDIASFSQIAQKAGMKVGGLLFTGDTSDEDRIYLYNLCTVYVVPCLQEDDDVHVLEAMACGAAIIGASNASGLAGLIGVNSALFDPMEEVAIAAKIREVLVDESFRSWLRAHCLQQSQLLSWDDTAKRAIAAWGAMSVEVICPAASVRDNSKPRLAFVSPLPPERTGIADYSVELLSVLAKYYEIDLVVAQDQINDALAAQYAEIRDIMWLKTNAQQIDRVLYHIGNSPFHSHILPVLQDVPGVVVLHDFYLGHLMQWLDHYSDPGVWARKLYEDHGYPALVQRYKSPDAASFDFPCTFDVIRNSRGVIVHSDYSRSLIEKWYGVGASEGVQTIPLLRKPAPLFDRAQIRKKMGLTADDFLVCSFGVLGPTKLNDRLVSSWLASSLAHDKKCHLIFVGENNSQYGQTILESITSTAQQDCIKITGFVSHKDYQQYLMAADLAVQLRTQSRGETSAAILDCMNYGVPVIVNTGGSMAELDPRALWMMSEQFTDDELIRALETLWKSSKERDKIRLLARQLIGANHSPNRCAEKYFDAIEFFYRKSELDTSALIRAIAAVKIDKSFGGLELRPLSNSIATTFPLAKAAKRLFLDVTVTSQDDYKTGIQRVVRAILLELIQNTGNGWRAEPIRLVENNGEWYYKHATNYTLNLLGCPSNEIRDEIIEPEAGDIICILDLTGSYLISAEKSGLYKRYKDRGVSVYSVVYDILPIQMPDVFPPYARDEHEKWAKCIAKYDGAICISETVAKDLAIWRKENEFDLRTNRPYKIGWFHLGADVINSAPTRGIPRNGLLKLARFRKSPTFLMVGTVEPRKGYLQVLEAFTLLWSKNIEFNLVIVGKEGWGGLSNDIRRDIPHAVYRLRSHAELNKRLFWLEGVSDEYLEKVYTASTCLIAASYGEGFGLPLIEAAQHKLPIIARDIPVFREVAGQHAYYFKADESADLADIIQKWVALYQQNQHPNSNNMPWLNWKESASQFLNALNLPVIIDK